jgi:hypothetical protein
MAAVLRLHFAAVLTVAAAALLHWTVFPHAPVRAFFASLLAGIIATAIMMILGKDPF